MHVVLSFIIQAIYSVSDLWKKLALGETGFRLSAFRSPLFIASLLVPGIGFVLQLYVFSRYELSRTVTLLGIFAVLFSVFFGVAFLKEKFTVWNYLGVLFAVFAILLVRHRS